MIEILAVIVLSALAFTVGYGFGWQAGFAQCETLLREVLKESKDTLKRSVERLRWMNGVLERISGWVKETR